MTELYKNKSWLGYTYTIEKRSIREIAREVGRGSTTIYRWLVKFGIKRRERSWYKGEKNAAWKGDEADPETIRRREDKRLYHLKKKESDLK